MGLPVGDIDQPYQRKLVEAFHYKDGIWSAFACRVGAARVQYLLFNLGNISTAWLRA
jgi:hypothetical protein